jgi:hypothetical protein
VCFADRPRDRGAFVGKDATYRAALPEVVAVLPFRFTWVVGVDHAHRVMPVLAWSIAMRSRMPIRAATSPADPAARQVSARRSGSTTGRTTHPAGASHVAAARRLSLLRIQARPRATRSRITARRALQDRNG